MNQKQQRVVDILTRLDAQALGIGDAAGLLGVSPRHVHRLLGRFRQEGFAAVVHGNLGRTPANRTDPALVERILALAGPGCKYEDLNVCHLYDLLDEEIKIGRSTLDRLLRKAGLRQKAGRSAPVHRRRRQRRPAEGMLLQMDASPYDWLEGRGPKAALIGGIDDATGKVLFLLFRPTEDQMGYLLLLRSIAQSYGIPMSIYHDRHTILRSPKKPTLEEELAGRLPMSQIQRVMEELGVESIPAYSPQAKGHIERLWGTLQDRLTKELRLAGITTLEEANAFLPGFIGRFNMRFGKDPEDPNSAWVPLSPGLDLNYYFSIRETRKVSSDHCIRWLGQVLQLLPGPKDPSLIGKRVEVHVVPEGDIYVYYDKHPVVYRPVLASDPVPVKPMPELIGQPRLANPKGKARQRAWLFRQG